MLRTTIRPALTHSLYCLPHSCPSRRATRHSTAESSEARVFNPPSNSVLPADPRSSSPTHGSATEAVDVQPAAGFTIIKSRMQKWATVVAVTTRQHTDSLLLKAHNEFSQLAGHLNHATGYDAIDVLKRQVADQGTYTSHLFSAFSRDVRDSDRFI